MKNLITNWKFWFALFLFLLIFVCYAFEHLNFLLVPPITFFMLVSGFLAIMFYMIKMEEEEENELV